MKQVYTSTTAKTLTIVTFIKQVLRCLRTWTGKSPGFSSQDRTADATDSHYRYLGKFIQPPLRLSVKLTPR